MSVNRIEGGIFTIIVVGIDNPQDPALEAGLDEQVSRSPGFFADAPVVLDLKSCLGCTAPSDLVALKGLLRRHHLVAIGVQNASRIQARAAQGAELAVFPATAGGRSAARGEHGERLKTTQGRTRLVTHPVRSGMQIYAKDADLVVTAPVSAGAELIADGHVHVYGALRGRAIAGARGDQDARIFAQRLEAELLAIAGRYMVSEAIAPQYLKQSVQVALVEERLCITSDF